MPLSIYDASVPTFVLMLSHLDGTLDKAAAYARSKKVDENDLLSTRLAPDMWSLAEQVRAACNFPVRTTMRLSGHPVPQFDGKDDSFDALKARVAFAIEYVQDVGRPAIDGTEDKQITFPTGDTEHTLAGKDYLLRFALPNFYFHLTAAYAILRSRGVPLVKEDYMGAV